MEGKMILENINHLWFFSNVLEPSSPSECVDGKSSEEQPHLLTDPESPKEVICQQEVRSLATCDHQGEAAESEERKTNAEESTMEETEVHMEIKEYFKGHMSLHTCFGGLELEARPVSAIWEHQRMRRSHKAQSFVRSLNCYAMPPMHNSLAMKAHLKSWAHAVACTVR